MGLDCNLLNTWWAAGSAGPCRGSATSLLVREPSEPWWVCLLGSQEVGSVPFSRMCKQSKRESPASTHWNSRALGQDWWLRQNPQRLGARNLKFKQDPLVILKCSQVGELPSVLRPSMLLALPAWLKCRVSPLHWRRAAPRWPRATLAGWESSSRPLSSLYH